MKMINALLREKAISLVQKDDTVPLSQQEVENESGKELSEAIYKYWVYDFCNRFNINAQIRTGNKNLSPAMVALNNKFLAHHLGSLKQAFDNGLDESTVQNFDETHLVIGMDDGRVLDFQGIKRVSYSDVASGRDCLLFACVYLLESTVRSKSNS